MQFSSGESSSESEGSENFEGSCTSEGSLDERDYDLDEEKGDLWYEEPLYDGSALTVGDAVLNILEIYIKNKQSKQSLEDTLKMTHKLLPQPNNLPRSKYCLEKLLDKLLPQDIKFAKKHRICEDCSEYLGLWSETKTKNCKNEKCNSSHINGAFFEFNITALLKNFFEQRDLKKLLIEHKNNVSPENSVNDICSGPFFQEWRKNVLKNDHDVCLLWNTDGTPLKKSSNSNIWLIQAQIVNIPVEKRRGFQFVCGIYYSRCKKPSMKSFFRPFVDTMISLSTKGVEWFDKQINETRKSIVIAPISTCDAPARAEVQCLQYFIGEYGCFCCEHQGISAAVGSGSNTVFLYPTNKKKEIIDSTVKFRTEQRMCLQAKRCLDENLEHVFGVKGPSIVTLLPYFDISRGFLPDHVHIFLLGIFRMLLDCFCNSSNKDEEYYIKKKSGKTSMMSYLI